MMKIAKDSDAYLRSLERKLIEWKNLKIDSRRTKGVGEWRMVESTILHYFERDTAAHSPGWKIPSVTGGSVG